MKNKTKELKKESKEYTSSVRREISSAILAAFAFLIALVWRDAISEFVNKITSYLLIQGSFITAIFVTLICVLGILLVKRYS